MKTITMKVPSRARFALAEYCAEMVHAAVVSMHLRRTGSEFSQELDAERIQEVRAMVKSLKGWDRRDFTLTIGYLFKRLRQEKRTEPRWQTYVARVEAYRKEQAA